MPEDNQPNRDRDQATTSRTNQGTETERQGTSGTSSTQRQGSPSDKGMNKEEETKKATGVNR